VVKKAQKDSYNVPRLKEVHNTGGGGRERGVVLTDKILRGGKNERQEELLVFSNSSQGREKNIANGVSQESGPSGADTGKALLKVSKLL